MPFVHAGDLSVHYIEQGAGDPVVLVHGNWAIGAWWLPTLARLPQGLRGIAPDLRGRGRTEGPDSDYAIASLAADMLALLDALELGRAHLVGHSLGAAVAMQLALDHPARVASLAVLAPPWVEGMPEAFYNPERQRMLAADPAMFAMALRAIAPTAPDDDAWRRLVAEGHRQRLAATLGAQDALRDWRPGDALGAIPCPKLAIGGEHDPLIPPPVAERAAQALGARLVIVAGAGHSPNIEAPGEFARLVFGHIAGA